jgi:DNA mismatch repair protein MSH2
VVCAINVEQQKDQSVVGVCFTDASSSMILGITEFVDNEAFSNLESLLIQQNIKECIIPGDVQSYEVIQIQRVVQKCDIVITETKKQAFQTKNIVQDLNRLLETGTNVEGLAELELQVAMSSTACIIDYLDVLNILT